MSARATLPAPATLGAPTDQDWLEVIHALVNLAERQGRMTLAVRLSEAADAAGDFQPYATEGGAR